MKIGITGAFGFLGASATAEFLSNPLAPDQEITAFGSTNFHSALFDEKRVEVRRLDILDKAQVAAAFHGLDIVLHFAGKVGFSEAEKKSVWRANVIGAHNVFSAVIEDRIPLLINISSVSALGPAPDSRALVETDRPYDDATSAWTFRSRREALDAVEESLRGGFGFLEKIRCIYLDSKLANLELAHEMRERRDLPVINILPGTAIGPGEAHTGIGTLIRSIVDGKMPLVLTGVSSYLHSRDFARGLGLALRRGRVGEDYILAGAPGNNLSLVELGRKALVASKRQRPLIAVPRAPARAAGFVAEKIAPRLGLSRGLVESGSVRAPCDCGKAMRELGYNPATPLERAITDYMDSVAP